jgi:hypothetical protein
MKRLTFLFVMFFGVQMGWTQDTTDVAGAYRFEVGIDISKPKLMYDRDHALAMEFLYSQPLHKRWRWHEAIGFHSKVLYSGGAPDDQKNNLKGIYLKTGIHHQFYKSNWFRKEKWLKTQKNEKFTIGLNAVTGVFHHELRKNIVGPFLRPYQMNTNQNAFYAGAEFETILNLYKIEGVVLQFSARLGTYKVFKQLENVDDIKVLPGLGIQNDIVYGEYLGLYLKFQM